jgi:hypothetical protein
MVYNEILVSRVISGAVMDDVIHDQWLEVEKDKTRFTVFDPDALFPENLAGSMLGVKLGLTPISLNRVPCPDEGFLGKNEFVCSVIDERVEGDLLVYLIVVRDLKIHLTWNKRLEVGSCYHVKGRLDLIDIRGLNNSGWRTVR